MSYPVHSGMASSFADVDDLESFKRCKAKGNSDKFCFAYGDNGIGCWGDDTTVDIPMCALPPEDWKTFKRPHGQRVLVTIHGCGVVCLLMDTMPHKANIKNGALIDLNPGAQKAFGLKPPFLVPATWQVVV